MSGKSITGLTIDLETLGRGWPSPHPTYTLELWLLEG